MSEQRDNNGLQRAGRANSLGLTRAMLDTLLDRLDAAPEGASAKRRKFARLRYRQESITLTMKQPGGSTVSMRLAGRNISCTGMCLLHGAYLHPGSPVMVSLPHPTIGMVDVHGKVVRCQHRIGVIHEIGIEFDATINAKEFAGIDRLSGVTSLEQIDAEKLTGTIMIVDSPLVSRMMRHYLKETKVTAHVASTIAEAIETAKRGVDLVLCSYQLEVFTAPELIEALRTAGVSAPVVVCTADSSRSVMESLAAARAAGMLPKPITQPRLIATIAEFLVADALKASGSQPKPLTDLATEFAEEFSMELQRFCRMLEEKLSRGQMLEAHMVCVEIRATAQTVGLDDIARVADAAASSLARTMSADESRMLLDDLFANCRNYIASKKQAA